MVLLDYVLDLALKTEQTHSHAVAKSPLKKALRRVKGRSVTERLRVLLRDQLKTLEQAEVILPKLKAVLDLMYITVNSIVVARCSITKICKGINDDVHQYCKTLMKITVAQNQELYALNRARTVRTNTQRVPVSKAFVLRIIDAGKKEDSTPEELFASLALACGSRWVELSRISSYEVVEGEAWQVGVAKGQTPEEGAARRVLKRLVGWEPEEFVAAVQRVRAELPPYTKLLANAKTQGFPGVHTYRKIFSQMACDLFCPPTTSRVAFISSALGHLNSYSMALEYQGFYLVE